MKSDAQFGWASAIFTAAGRRQLYCLSDCFGLHDRSSSCIFDWDNLRVSTGKALRGPESTIRLCHA